MAFDFLKPVGQRVLAHCELLPPQALGQVIYKHTEQDGLPVLVNEYVSGLRLDARIARLRARAETLRAQ